MPCSMRWLLVDVALHVGLHALRGGRVGIAFGGVAFKPVDLAAFLVLRALDARLLGRAELAVFRGVRFHAFDAGSPLSSCDASRVFSDPLFSPCSIRRCWFTSRCTSEPLFAPKLRPKTDRRLRLR